MNNIFQLGEFRLNSGRISKFKIECDNLTDDDIEAFAFMISKLIGNFIEVRGVPRGGIRLANALKQYRTYGPKLIVDDVLTTGNSMERFKAEWDNSAPISSYGFIGATIYSRGQCPTWIKAVCQLPKELWSV